MALSHKRTMIRRGVMFRHVLARIQENNRGNIIKFKETLFGIEARSRGVADNGLKKAGVCARDNTQITVRLAARHADKAST